MWLACSGCCRFHEQPPPCLSISVLDDRQLVARPMLRGVTSDSTVRSQVLRGRPDLWFQYLGKEASAILKKIATLLQRTD